MCLSYVIMCEYGGVIEDMEETQEAQTSEHSQMTIFLHVDSSMAVVERKIISRDENNRKEKNWRDIIGRK